MTRRILIGLLMLGGTIALIVFAIMNRPQPPKRVPTIPVIPVETTVVEKQAAQFIIDSQGPVKPLIESNLVSEVSGRITNVSDKFRVGSFVKKGDILLTIDDANYTANLRTAQASLAQAKAAYQDAQARTDQARKDWKKIGKGEASPLVLRLPQLNQAKASVQSADAALMRAQRDLERTKVRATYDALIKSKQVDLGQFVNMGTPVATLNGTEFAEIRLPVPDKELGFMRLPRQGNDDSQTDVRLTGTYADKPHHWFGKVVRTEGVIDESNRLTYLVAQIEDPYNLKEQLQDDAPLRYGSFIKAEIAGLELDNLIKLPRQAIYNNNQVMTLTNENEVTLVSVEIVRNEQNTVFIASGLETSDEVIVTPIENPINGMKVKRLSDMQKEAEERRKAMAEAMKKQQAAQNGEEPSEETDAAATTAISQ